MLPFRTVLGEAELDFNHYYHHRSCRALIVSVVKCSILFYKCLPAVHALFIRGEGGFHTSEGKPKHPLLFLWCPKSLARLWILSLPKNSMVTLSICSIHHVQDRVWARLFPFLCFTFSLALSHALLLILFLISCSVFRMSELLRTNQRLYFTNVTLSRLWCGCGDNEGL